VCRSGADDFTSDDAAGTKDGKSGDGTPTRDPFVLDVAANVSGQPTI
jgi:hypothetical protein